MNEQEVIDIFNEAYYATYRDEVCLWYVWHGGLTVNMYTAYGDAVDCFTLGDAIEIEGKSKIWEIYDELDEHIESNVKYLTEELESL